VEEVRLNNLKVAAEGYYYCLVSEIAN